MDTTDAWIDSRMTTWPVTSMTGRPSWHRLEGFSAWDQAKLAEAFVTHSRSSLGCEPWADPIGRFGVDTKGAVTWIPPILSCGYHDPVGISVEIDADYGGGFVTRPALPPALAGSDVLSRLIHRTRRLVPQGRGSDTVDVHAVRLRGGSVWTRSALPTVRATVAVLISPQAASSQFNSTSSAWELPKLRRPFDTVAWTSTGGYTPSPADVVEGDSGNILLITFRG